VRERWDNRWKYIVVSSDFLLGVGVAVAVFVLADAKPQLREPHLLDVSTGVSVAILAVVIAAFAILAAFLSDDYNFILTKALGGTGRAFEPYALVAIVAGLAALVSVGGMFLWPVVHGWWRALIMALSLGLTTWAVVGTVQLVGITATHGRHRLRIPEIRAAATEARTKAGAKPPAPPRD
jgi:hypothetical protein